MLHYHPSLLRTTLGLLTAVLTGCITSVEIPATISPSKQSGGLSPAPVSPSPTEAPARSATVAQTPPVLSGIYLPEYLNPLDKPEPYIADTCEYLKNKWDPSKADPGTVVMIIMLNNINRGDKPNSSDSITVVQFERMIANIAEQGFEAINTEQLADFLESNRTIPPRSVLFLQDGRRTAGNYERHFRQLWEESGWPVVNSWIVQPDTPEPLWLDNLALEQEGFVDHQLYSPLHRFSDKASTDFLSSELKKSVEIFEERYEKVPIAITWPNVPGTNFPKAARQMGFRLGFTQNARGPVMYNWIPQAEHEDLSRPAYYPEKPFNDPLMTLPRYWPLQVLEVLDQVRLIGKDAAAYAEQNKADELDFYNIVCAPEYGRIPNK